VVTAPIAPKEALPSATILLVEDDEASRSGFELMLRLSGYRVVTAADAGEAIERAQQHAPDLVLCDVNLPDGNGYALTEKLRLDGRYADTPIILMSADARSSRRVIGLDRGADDFVEKPVDFDELLARIRCHLRHMERERELRRRCTYDALTGVLSRAAVEDELVRELKRRSRTGLAVSVIIFDLDGFKAINDVHGHAAGDDALRKTARTLTHLLRSTDRLGRIGGDEFLAVLPDTNAPEASQLMARIEEAWRHQPPRPRGVDAPVLISMGTATARADESLHAVLRRADRAMYDKKYKRRTSGVRPGPR
jgi:diguanylate cyclase (GGDEF)-like protein